MQTLLEPDMSQAEISRYLQSELKRSIDAEVGTLIRSDDLPWCIFAIPRLVLSCVDFLGALYCGEFRIRFGHQKVFTDKTKALKFLADMFGPFDSNYATYGELLWLMYRHGTVHLHQPRESLVNQRREITWALYKGDREKCGLKLDPIPELPQLQTSIDATHLVPADRGDNYWVQPISVDCLYRDLLSSVDKFDQAIKANTELEATFRETANLIILPQTTTLEWWTT